jgi:hypothetical protein
MQKASSLDFGEGAPYCHQIREVIQCTLPSHLEGFDGDGADVGEGGGVLRGHRRLEVAHGGVAGGEQGEAGPEVGVDEEGNGGLPAVGVRMWQRRRRRRRRGGHCGWCGRRQGGGKGKRRMVEETKRRGVLEGLRLLIVYYFIFRLGQIIQDHALKFLNCISKIRSEII